MWNKAEAALIDALYSTLNPAPETLSPGFHPLQVWNKAEAALTDALNSTGLKWTINEGGGGRD